jgi:hypothetical protein
MLVFFIVFEKAIMVYICTSNMYTLILSTFLRIPKLRAFCRLPVLDKKTEKTIEKKLKTYEKGFLQGFKESYRNQKLVSEVQQREKLKMTKFEQAGLGAPLKTYKSNPKETKK